MKREDTFATYCISYHGTKNDKKITMRNLDTQ